MAIYVKNLATGETKKVNNVRVNDGEIVAEWQCNEPKVGGGFDRNYPFLKRTEKTQHHEAKNKDCRVFDLEEGYELVKKEKGEPKPAKVDEVKAGEAGVDEAKVDAPAEADDIQREEVKAEEPAKVEKPKKAAKNQPKQDDTKVDDDAKALAEILGRMKGGNIDEETVRRIVEEVLAGMAEKEPAKVKKLAKKAAKKDGEQEYYCNGFDAMVQDVADGYCVYMHGPAGTGKSHTAKQIADKLGLPYYESMQMEFAHEAKGYGDAGGNYVPTPLFKAATEGGLFFMDEFDRSRPEVTTVVNTLLANGRFDFPVVGNIEAHPNFRVIAAGNTCMMGAEDGYVAANELDASTRDRFAFYEVNYDRRVELNVIAKGDVSTVDFVEDVRKAIELAGLQFVVSYRATDYMCTRKAAGVKLQDILTRKTFAGLKADEIRVIYGGLSNTENEWAKAMKKLF